MNSLIHRNFCILLIAFFAFMPNGAFAVLGLTAAECTKKYGRPVEAASTFELPPHARTRYSYKWSGFYISAVFAGRDVTDSRCVSLSYQSESNTRPNGPIVEMTAAEIDTLLALNANGSSWEKTPNGWKRKDGRAFAREFKSTTNGFPTNMLTVFSADFDPKMAAEVTGGAQTK